MPTTDEKDTRGSEADLSRVVVIGTSGSGKTTMAKDISEILGVTHVEFDAYRHGPNWTETPDDIFRGQLAEALSADRWVADGNYSVARGVVWPRATAIVWLDLPFPVVFWRLFWRTMKRGIFRVELWNGNRENLWEHFISKDSLFLWAINTHWKRRKSLALEFAKPEHSHLRVVHLRSPRMARRWLKSVVS